MGSGPPAGLVILKHREGAALDFAAFSTRTRTPFLGDFDELTRREGRRRLDHQGPARGSLRTHFDRAGLLHRPRRRQRAARHRVGRRPPRPSSSRSATCSSSRGPDGCYNSLDSRVVGDRRRAAGAAQPHPLLPRGERRRLRRARRLPDLPLRPARLRGGGDHGGEHLRARQRAPLRRRDLAAEPEAPAATGTIGGNVVAGFAAAGDDVARHGPPALRDRHRAHRPAHRADAEAHFHAALAHRGWAMRRLASTGQPVEAFGEILVGAFSAVHGGRRRRERRSPTRCVNPLLQSTVGLASTGGRGQHGALGGRLHPGRGPEPALLRALGGRLQPDRRLAAQPGLRDRSGYTRTDTQLNIDRVMTLANIFAIRAIVLSSGNGAEATVGAGGNAGTGDTPRGGGGGGGLCAEPPPVPPPPSPPVVATPPPGRPTPTASRLRRPSSTPASEAGDGPLALDRLRREPGSAGLALDRLQVVGQVSRTRRKVV